MLWSSKPCSACVGCLLTWYGSLGACLSDERASRARRSASRDNTLALLQQGHARQCNYQHSTRSCKVQDVYLYGKSAANTDISPCVSHECAVCLTPPVPPEVLIGRHLGWGVRHPPVRKAPSIPKPLVNVWSEGAPVSTAGTHAHATYKAATGAKAASSGPWVMAALCSTLGCSLVA